MAVGLGGGVEVADTPRHDDELRDYGFAPVGTPLLPRWGVRGRLRYPGGWVVSVAMSSAFATHRDPVTPVPTTTSWTRMGAGVGRALAGPVGAGVQLGFGSLTHTVGSDVQGGALVYLGPYLAPELRLELFAAPQWLQLTVGLPVQLNPGPAHQQALWEEPFTRRVSVAGVLSVTTGPGWAP